MHRAWAIIERELRRFRRSPVLIMISLIFPVVQLVILGYAFGGNVKHLKVAIVDQDHGVPAVRVRELASAMSSGAGTIDTVDYADPGVAVLSLAVQSTTLDDVFVHYTGRALRDELQDASAKDSPFMMRRG